MKKKNMINFYNLCNSFEIVFENGIIILFTYRKSKFTIQLIKDGSIKSVISYDTFENAIKAMTMIEDEGWIEEKLNSIE